MKKPQKTLYAVLALLMCLVILVGCAQQPPPAPQVGEGDSPTSDPIEASEPEGEEPEEAPVSPSSDEPITISLETSVYVEAPHKAALDALKAAYEDANPNVTIEIYGAPYAEYWDKLTTEIVAGTEACIVQLQEDATRYATYASLREGETGAFVNLDPYIKGTDLETNLTGQELLTYNGHYIGISNYAWGVHGVFYRKSILQEAGIDPATIVTWDDLLNAAIELTKPQTADEPAQYGFGILIGPAPLALSEWEQAIARPVGQGFFFPNEEGPFTADRVNINTAPIAWAAQFWQDLNFKHHVTSVGHQTKGDVRNQFWTGQVAMTIEGPWFTGMTAAADPTVLEDTGVFPLPKAVYEGEEYIYHASPNAVTHLISSNCEHPDEAWKFLEWMASPEGQALVATSGMIPANTAYSSSDAYRQDYPINAEIVKFLDVYASPMPRPGIPQSGEIVRIALDAAQEMFVTGDDVQTALDTAAARIQDVLNK